MLPILDARELFPELPSGAVMLVTRHGPYCSACGQRVHQAMESTAHRFRPALGRGNLPALLACGVAFEAVGMVDYPPAMTAHYAAHFSGKLPVAQLPNILAVRVLTDLNAIHENPA